LPLEVVVRVVPAPKVTLSLYVCDPEVLTEPPLIAVVPLAFVVKLVKGVDPPIIPENVVVPVVLTFNVNAPSIVPPKVIFPDVFPEILAFAVKTVGVSESPIEIVEFVAITFPPILTWLGAVIVTPPVNVVASPPPFPRVTVPVLEKVVAPAIVLIVPLNTTL